MQVFTSLLVLSIFFGVYVITDIRSYKLRKVESLTSLAQVIGTNSISTLRFQDNETARKILMELHDVAPEIIHADILDKKGNYFASYTKAGADSFLLPALNGAAYKFTDLHLYVSHPILDDTEKVGTVILDAELSEMARITQSRNKVTALLLIVALGASFLIAIVVQRYISKRLVRLVATMKEVRETGDYEKPIAEKGKDEVATLIGMFNSMMLQIKENQQRKDEFIAIASHELKTPLTSVKGYLQLVDMNEDMEQNKPYVQKALENLHKLEKLIKDLLDVSNIKSGQLKLNKKEFSIDHLLDEIIASFRISTRTHELVREDNFDGSTVVADRQRIEQVMVNLLSNAIKYSPEGKKVIIRSERTDTEFIVKIRDFGIGVSKEEQANIFERYYRTKDATSNISGFGLGLYISRDIILRHLGRIWVEAAEKGSSFCFSLPAV